MMMEKLKKEQKYTIKEYGLDSKEAYNMTIRLSIEKDKKYNKNAIQNYYNESFEALVEYLKANENNPNEYIWNRFAIKNGYLSAQAIGYIYGKGFNNLCREIRKGFTRYKKSKHRNTI